MTIPVHTAAPSTKVRVLDASTATTDAVVQALIQAGGVLIRNLVPKEILSKVEADVRPHLDADKAWEGDFFPPETRRAYGLAGKSKPFTQHIVANSLFQDVCDRLLSSTMHHYIGDKLDTSVSKPQLNNTIVFSIGPGARAQELHRDDMTHHNRNVAIDASDYEIGRDTGIGLFVAGKKTTKANGATRFIPGSHLWDTLHPPQEDIAFFAEMDPGDAFMMLSSCYHGGSANTTVDEERLVYSCFMTKGYLRQEENQYLASPAEAIRQYPVKIQKIVGYTVSHPFLGWLDLGDPRKALYGREWNEKAGGDLL